MSQIDFNNVIIYILYGWLTLILSICAISDIRHRRIPNILTYPTILVALTTYCVIDGLQGLLYGLGGLVFGFVMFLIPYVAGGMGAGDVKLMAAVGTVLGFKQTAVCFLFIAVCGGIMALGFMIYRHNLKNTLLKTFLSILYLGMHKDASLLKRNKNEIIQEGIPYGVAIASGVFLFFSYLMVNNKSLSAFLVT
jgi:prepilin peptidase CpaA